MRLESFFHDEEFKTEVKRAIDSKTKPPGSLGLLEDIAFQMACLQKTLAPKAEKAKIYVFAGDHGFAARGLSAYPQEVTFQMVLNFLNGGAAINVFAREAGAELRVVNAGVAENLPKHPLLVDLSLGRGTADALNGPAMSRAQAEEALARGGRLVAEACAGSCDILVFGEMGIANTSSATLLAWALTGRNIEELVGPGTGLTSAGLRRKTELLKQCAALHGRPANPFGALERFGGFEIAMMAGAFLKAGELGVAAVVDGFIATAAALVAVRMDPACARSLIFAHRSGEPGHGVLLEALDARPLLDIGLRLGEGTGAALVLPLVRAACAFLRDMASFETAGVSESLDSGGESGRQGPAPAPGTSP